MFRKTSCLAGIMLAALLFLLGPANHGLAHEISTAGPYRIAIGWQFEPPSGSVTWVGQPNAVQIFVDQPKPGNDMGSPVGDLNGDCSHPDIQVTVTFGNTTSSPLCPQPTYDADTSRGRQDEYDAAVTPTKVGDYTLHVFGTIHGTKVDHTVKSGPQTFDSVGDQSSVEFPSAAPALGDVATKVDQVGSRSADAAAAANAATDAANRSSALGIVGIVLAAIAVILGGVAFLTARRRSGS